MEDNTRNDNTTGNVSDNRSLDTRRWKEQDNAGHIKGSRQEGSVEDNTEEQRQQEDTSELNKLDDRGNPGGNEVI